MICNLQVNFNTSSEFLSEKDLVLLRRTENSTYFKQKPVLKTNTEKKEESIPFSTSPSPPLVPPKVGESEGKPLVFKTKTDNLKLEISPPTKKTINKTPWAYVPSGLTKQDKQNLGQQLELAYCVMHLIHYLRVRQNLGKHDWIALGAKYCVEVFGGKEGCNWYKTREIMLKSGILQQAKENVIEDEFGLGVSLVSQRGVKGTVPYGYRLREDLRLSDFHKTLLNDPTAKKISQRAKVCGFTLRWLEANLGQVTIEPVPTDVIDKIAEGSVTRAEAYTEQVKWINEDCFYCEADSFSGRLHTNLTGLKRELRPFLRVDGSPLCQIDIPCSQLGFIALCAKKEGNQHHKQFVDDNFFEVWNNDLYAYLAEKLGVTRKEIKQGLTQSGLFASNKSKHQKSAVMKLFALEFPKLAEYIKNTKNYKPKASDEEKTKQKPYRVLAQKAQKAERDFIIEKVCKRIRASNPEVWVSTIHDSLLVKPADAQLVKTIMEEEFSKENLHPKLKIDYFALQTRSVKREL